MTLNKLKATLLRFRDLSWRDMTQLATWSKRRFDTEHVTSPSYLVAAAKNAAGDVVCYANIRTVMLISYFAVNPQATPTEAYLGGDVIEKEVERQAALAGISQVLVVVPEDHRAVLDGEWKNLRVYEREIPQTTIPNLGCSYPSQAAQYLN